MGLDDLSAAQCILLAVNYAAASDIISLHKLTPARTDVFDQELVFRILLTFLPESLEPAVYTTFIREVGTRIYLEQHTTEDFNLESVQNLSTAEATSRVRKLHLKPLADARELKHGVKDSLTLFLVHRARLIDSETGLLPLIPHLVGPFIDRTDYLRDWFISSVLPLLRLDYEYHTQPKDTLPLAEFETWFGFDGVDNIVNRALSNSRGTPSPEQIATEFRGIVGPWTCGSNHRKRAGLGYRPLRQPLEEELRKSVDKEADGMLHCKIEGCASRFQEDKTWRIHVKKKHGMKLEQLDSDESIPSSQTPELHYSDTPISLKKADWVNGWRCSFEWIVNKSVNDFPLVINLFEGWDGPGDIDLGENGQTLRRQTHDSDLDLDLLRQYCQAAFASIYAVDLDNEATIDGAHALLVRLAELLGFVPPPDLATSIDSLPRIERHTQDLDKLPRDLLQYQALLLPEQPLTTPHVEAFSLLQMFVYSSYQLLHIGQPMSVAKVGKVRFWSDATEQLQIVRDILDIFSKQRKNESQWAHLRSVLLWLWGWGLEECIDAPEEGYGVFGKVSKPVLEEEMLRAMCGYSQVGLAIKTYIGPPKSKRPLEIAAVEKAIGDSILSHFDAATNGNKTRGGMKRAADLINSMKPYFGESERFKKLSAMVDATHSLSFYSLTLQPGVPLPPRSIRQIGDPLSLIQKLLEQNPGSYTKLDDLVSIAKRLIYALSDDDPNECERQVTGLAIEATLTEDDFETAYSYVVNRLTTVDLSQDARKASSPQDDVAWKAAFHAGKHRTQVSATSTAQSSPQVRRLEQRMELLSQSLLLAPPTALPEVLAAWRRCEEELLTVLAEEQADETAFDDQADKGNVTIPGGFGIVPDTSFTVQPRRKELGRGATEEAPMGLFDVARGAAAAFGRNASALRTKAGDLGGAIPRGSAESEATYSDDQGNRVRKRDMVANAVTGSLASGIGWMIGATPVRPEEKQ